LESVDRGIWDVVINALFVPVNVVNDVQEPNPFLQWTVDENRWANMMLRLEILSHMLSPLMNFIGY